MFILFWACVLCLLHAPHILLMHPIIIIKFFFILSFTFVLFVIKFSFILFCYLSIFLKKKRVNKNVLNYKNYKEKIGKSKNEKCSLLLYCVCPVARTVWHSFSKIPKIVFLFSFSVCLTARVIWHIFSSNSKNTKKIQNFQNTKISTFSSKKSFLRTTWS